MQLDRKLRRRVVVGFVIDYLRDTVRGELSVKDLAKAVDTYTRYTVSPTTLGQLLRQTVNAGVLVRKCETHNWTSYRFAHERVNT
jgi:hypothetical protein